VLQHYVDQAIILLPENFDPQTDRDPRTFDFSSANTGTNPGSENTNAEYEQYGLVVGSYDEFNVSLAPYAVYKYPSRLQEFDFGYNCARDCVLSDWSSFGGCQVSDDDPRAPQCGKLGVRVARRSVVVPPNRWGSCADLSEFIKSTRCLGDPCPGTSTLQIQFTILGATVEMFDQEGYLIAIESGLRNASAEVGLTAVEFGVSLVSVAVISASSRQLEIVNAAFNDDMSAASGASDIATSNQVNVAFDGAVFPPAARRLQSVSNGLVVTTAVTVNTQAPTQVALFQQATQTVYSPVALQAVLIAQGIVPSGASVTAAQVTVQSATPSSNQNGPGSPTAPEAPATEGTAALIPKNTIQQPASPKCFLEPASNLHYLVAIPVLERVSEGAEVEVRLAPFSANRKLNSDAFTSKVTSMPHYGQISQLSEVFAKHGYPPISGEPLSHDTLPALPVFKSSIAFRSPKRHFKSKGAYGILSYTTQYKGRPDSAANGEVYFVPESGLVAQHGFVFGAEGWTVQNNGIGSGIGKGRGAIQHASHAEGPTLNRFIFAKDYDIQRDSRNSAPSAQDRSPWYFQAPASFVRDSRAATGGYLSFILSISPEFSFKDVGVLAERLPLVEFECPVCPLHSRVFRYYLPADKWPNSHVAVKMSVPLVFSEWHRGPQAWQAAGRSDHAQHPRVEPRLLSKSSNNPVCECEFWKAMQFMENLRIFGDVTSTSESVKLDSAQFTAAATGTLDIPVGCLQTDKHSRNNI